MFSLEIGPFLRLNHYRESNRLVCAPKKSKEGREIVFTKVARPLAEGQSARRALNAD